MAKFLNSHFVVIYIVEIERMTSMIKHDYMMLVLLHMNHMIYWSPYDY